MVEHDLAKVGVEGSNPFARSKVHLSSADALLRTGAKKCVRAVSNFDNSSDSTTDLKGAAVAYRYVALASDS